MFLMEFKSSSRESGPGPKLTILSSVMLALQAWDFGHLKPVKVLYAPSPLLLKMVYSFLKL